MLLVESHRFIPYGFFTGDLDDPWQPVALDDASSSREGRESQGAPGDEDAILGLMTGKSSSKDKPVYANEGHERRANSLEALSILCKSQAFSHHLEALLATQGKT